MAMDGLTEVLIPTERKVEYCRMIGALNLSNLAFGQRYHCEKKTAVNVTYYRIPGYKTYTEDKGEGAEDADSEADRDHVVHTMGTEHLRRETAPRDAIRYGETVSAPGQSNATSRKEEAYS